MFSGFEINKIINGYIYNFLFPKRLSHKLLSETRNKWLNKTLYTNGLTELTFVTHKKNYFDAIKSQCTAYLCQGERNVKHVVSFSNGSLYFYYFMRIEMFGDWIGLKSKLKFPKLRSTDHVNMQINNDMIYFDSVAINVRRGDFIALG